MYTQKLTNENTFNTPDVYEREIDPACHMITSVMIAALWGGTLFAVGGHVFSRFTGVDLSRANNQNLISESFFIGCVLTGGLTIAFNILVRSAQKVAEHAVNAGLSNYSP